MIDETARSALKGDRQAHYVPSPRRPSDGWKWMEDVEEHAEEASGMEAEAERPNGG
jgi:hypothetical protein